VIATLLALFLSDPSGNIQPQAQPTSGDTTQICFQIAGTESCVSSDGQTIVSASLSIICGATEPVTAIAKNAEGLTSLQSNTINARGLPCPPLLIAP